MCAGVYFSTSANEYKHDTLDKNVTWIHQGLSIFIANETKFVILPY